MKTVLILAIIVVSAYADDIISKEERERIGNYLSEKAKELSLNKIQKEELVDSGIEDIVKRSSKSGSCVDDAVQEWKREGNKMIESAYNDPITMLRNIADECLTLDEERMEIVLIDVDSGNLENELNFMQQHVDDEIQKILQSFADSIENCQ